MKRKSELVVPLLFAAAAPLVVYSVQRVFLHTPNERTMGTAFKIFFFHVPMGWLCMLMALISGIAAYVQLRRRSRTAGAVALAAAEIGFLGGLGVLLTGPIWGHATWGTPWTGDARQVTTALLWLVIAAYLLLRHFGQHASERLAAALAIFGAVNVPLIYYAVKLWKTTHPTTGVVAKLPPEMWATFWPGLAALLLVSFGLFAIRARQLILAGELDEAYVRLEDSRA
ncbi:MULTISPECIES: cytochrome c biogenesis protein CcsA [Nannocystis]|uniref:Heme exporter protein C n=1 Tax=Nannocystis radixulma TaxID=2995305 RepID=A0ABT5BA44_9BACT|nr:MULTISPECIES: cytochrome c biogenesis protein CcsA [Nannocystis]MCY1055193.1 cytochrome c biogenesis protein CcsA [Nannocystis sp. SCPEA4]MDC0671011.1 cytochrome c biogenesis protein CcsA [Nannocystis radixulma]